MIPYSRQLIGSSEVKAVVKTLKSNFLTQGSNLQKFENTLSKKFSSKYSVGFKQRHKRIAYLLYGFRRSKKGM